MAPDHAAWRFREHAFLRDGGLARLYARHGVDTTGTRALQAAWLTGP